MQPGTATLCIYAPLAAAAAPSPTRLADDAMAAVAGPPPGMEGKCR
jgi:hypothetical protein